MLKKQICFVFGFVFVLVAGQQIPSRPPKPPRLSGSYSDYPGLLVNKNPIQTNRQQNLQNNVLPPPRVSSVSSSSNVVRKPSGPIVIPAASSGYRGLPSNASPMVVPPQSSTYNGLPRSAQGIPVSVIAAAELSQQYEKPKAPIKTGTDTWTPMGFTGDGKSFDMSTARPKTGSNQAVGSAQNVTPQPQPIPYDTTASKKTIGQQIIERQQKQQQQQPQQYDIFGFPIDNSPGAVSGSNQGLSGGFSQSGPFGNNMLQMMLMMQLLGGDAPDPPARGRGRGRPGRPGAPSSPMSALEQLFRMEEMRLRRQQELANRNRRRPNNKIPRPSQRIGQQPSSQQKRYSPAIDTKPKIPKPTRTKSVAILRPGSAPRRRAPVRQSLHPAVLDRRDMPTTPAPATQGQEPVEREGQAAAAPQAPKQPPFRQSAIERHSIRTNYAPATQYREPSMQYNQASTRPHNEPPMSYNERSPAGNMNYGQSNSAYQDQFSGGFQQQPQPSPPPFQQRPPFQQQPPPFQQPPTFQQQPPFQQPSPFQQPQPFQQPPPFQQQPNPYQQESNSNSMAAVRDQRLAGRRNLSPNVVPRNIQQLVNNPLFQRRIRTAGATPGANPADVRADQADLAADRADNLQAMSPMLTMMRMAMHGAPGGTSPVGLTPLSNMFGSGGATGNPFGMVGGAI